MVAQSIAHDVERCSRRTLATVRANCGGSNGLASAVDVLELAIEHDPEHSVKSGSYTVRPSIIDEHSVCVYRGEAARVTDHVPLLKLVQTTSVTAISRTRVLVTSVNWVEVAWHY